MADCELLAGCLFFNDKMENRPSTATMYKRRFCQGDNAECARFAVFRALGKPGVPDDLFPNQFHRVKKIIAGS